MFSLSFLLLFLLSMSSLNHHDVLAFSTSVKQSHSPPKQRQQFLIVNHMSTDGVIEPDQFGDVLKKKEKKIRNDDDDGNDDDSAASVAAEGEEVKAEEVIEEEEEVIEEDPEITALKDEIARLEIDLKEKRRQVDVTTEQADEYTKAGYARKVAEMENMRRTRSRLQSNDKSSAIASIVADFLPIYDELNTLKSNYGEDDFGKQLNGLPEAMNNAFNELKVTDFSANTNDAMDYARYRAIEKVHNNDIPTDTVLESLDMGLELDGNVIRKATCVMSLGPEVVEEEEQLATEEETSNEEVAAEEQQPPTTATSNDKETTEVPDLDVE